MFLFQSMYMYIVTVYIVTVSLFCYDSKFMKIYIVTVAHERNITVSNVITKDKTVAFKNYLKRINLRVTC